jgi:hypothetical protein
MKAAHCCSHNCNQGRDCPNRSAHGTAGNVAILSVLAVFFVICLAYVGPNIDDHSAESAQAAEAIAQQRHEQRLTERGKAICGEGAAWQIDGNTLQCFTHRGRKTITAQVTP